MKISATPAVRAMGTRTSKILFTNGRILKSVRLTADFHCWGIAMASLREDIVQLRVAVGRSMLADSTSRYSGHLARGYSVSRVAVASETARRMREVSRAAQPGVIVMGTQATRWHPGPIARHPPARSVSDNIKQSLIAQSPKLSVTRCAEETGAWSSITSGCCVRECSAFCGV